MNGQCFICERYGTALQIVGPNGKARHEDCAPGSQAWIDWYRRQPKRARTSAGDILFAHHTGKASLRPTD